MQQQPSKTVIRSSMAQNVYIILVNWNGWQDTIECLESVFRLEYPNYNVVVCDNASTDGSLEQIRLWAQGRNAASCSNSELGHLSDPPVPKAIVFGEYKHPGEFGLLSACPRLVLIQCGANRGFAGGSNIGLRFALAHGDCDFVWLLNNDTVVRPDALLRLVERMRERPEAGICGSTLLCYSDVTRVQACGGASYNKWLARSRHLGMGLRFDQIPEQEAIERRMGYVMGASMLVRKSFLERIGLLNEEYFLYFEEIDWATRASGKFTLAYSSRSVVYHKEGRSIGSSHLRKKRSLVSERFAARSRLIFTRKYFPGVYPFVVIMVALTAMQRLLSGSVDAANVIWNSLAGVVGHRQMRLLSDDISGH